MLLYSNKDLKSKTKYLNQVNHQHDKYSQEGLSNSTMESEFAHSEHRFHPWPPHNVPWTPPGMFTECQNRSKTWTLLNMVQKLMQTYWFCIYFFNINYLHFGSISIFVGIRIIITLLLVINSIIRLIKIRVKLS